MKLKENVNFQSPLCRFLIYYYLENTKKAKIMQRITSRMWHMRQHLNEDIFILVDGHNRYGNNMTRVAMGSEIWEVLKMSFKPQKTYYEQYMVDIVQSEKS